MHKELPVWRSLMYVPVNVEKYVDKAHTRGADVIQLDIEDSVPPAEKERAFFMALLFFIGVAALVSVLVAYHVKIRGRVVEAHLGLAAPEADALARESLGAYTNSLSVSLNVAVGSSKITSRASWPRARATSISWRSAMRSSDSR